MEKKGKDKYQRSRNKEHGLAMQSREKNKLLFALSIRLTCCKTLCSGSLYSMERRNVAVCIYRPEMFVLCRFHIPWLI